MILFEYLLVGASTPPRSSVQPRNSSTAEILIEGTAEASRLDLPA